MKKFLDTLKAAGSLFVWLSVFAWGGSAGAEEPSAEPAPVGLVIREVIEPSSGASGCCGIPTHACAPDTKLGAVIIDHSMVSGVKLLQAPGQKFPEIYSYVRIDLNREGEKALAEGTTKNVGKRIAILIDGKVVALPVVNETIRGGYITWSGENNSETREAADKLSKASELLKKS